jgi:hypothetical protein
MIRFIAVTLSSCLLAASAYAGDAIPECLATGQAIPIDNAKVLQLKTSTPNQFLTRAHISGTVERVYPDHNGHDHFEVQIGKVPTDTVEVIYNQSFGALPSLEVGATVEACGDYITSVAPAGSYPASPDGAILHWVHKNPKGHGHESGYVGVNGALFGQGHGNGGS